MTTRQDVATLIGMCGPGTPTHSSALPAGFPDPALPGDDDTPPDSEPADTTRVGAGTIVTVGYTHHRPDGNRWVAGIGDLPQPSALDIPLSGTPRWLVTAPLADGSLWVAVLDDGAAEAFAVSGRVAVPREIVPARLEPGAPPLLYVDAGGAARLADLTHLGASPLTAPALLDAETPTFAFVTTAGDLALADTTAVCTLGVDALPDARGHSVDERGERHPLALGGGGTRQHQSGGRRDR